MCCVAWNWIHVVWKMSNYCEAKKSALLVFCCFFGVEKKYFSFFLRVSQREQKQTCQNFRRKNSGFVKKRMKASTLFCWTLLLLAAPVLLCYASCMNDKECFPATCCHASLCVDKRDAPACKGRPRPPCTSDCMPFTMDCGGSCICTERKKCAAVFGNATSESIASITSKRTAALNKKLKSFHSRLHH